MPSKIPKSKLRKVRDWGVIMMLKHTKPWVKRSRKKQESKDKCRTKVKED